MARFKNTSVQLSQLLTASETFKACNGTKKVETQKARSLTDMEDGTGTLSLAVMLALLAVFDLNPFGPPSVESLFCNQTFP